jgi:hypothetical protein
MGGRFCPDDEVFRLSVHGTMAMMYTTTEIASMSVIPVKAESTGTLDSGSSPE